MLPGTLGWLDIDTGFRMSSMRYLSRQASQLGLRHLPSLSTHGTVLSLPDIHIVTATLVLGTPAAAAAGTRANRGDCRPPQSATHPWRARQRAGRSGTSLVDELCLRMISQFCW